MLNLIKCRLLQTVRNKGDMFWALLFPILLVTFMNFSFGQGDSTETIKAIPVALVIEESSASENFVKFTEEIPDILKSREMTEEKALKELDERKIDGIFYAGDTKRLVVAESSLNTSILKSLMDTYLKNESMITEIGSTHPEKLPQALERLSEYKEMTKKVTVGGNTLDTNLAYFFAAIAMACLYGCFIGDKCSFDIKANLSALGARRSITPTHRLKLIFADMAATIAVHFGNVLLLLLHMKYILGIDFGNQMGGMIATCFLGSTIGVALGILVGSIGKMAEGGKIGIMLAVSMISSVLSGLMVGNMKDIVETHAPIINRINPAALISDAFYCLNVYNDMGRYIQNMATMAVMSIFMIFLSFMIVRRERYDSI